MWIETLRLKDFRNYDELTLHPSSGVNILYGQNGSGDGRTGGTGIRKLYEKTDRVQPAALLL